MSKEIEEGCRAVIVNTANGEQEGLAVTVGKFIGESPLIEGRNHWAVDKSIKYEYAEAFSVDESFLRRIDDHDDKEELGSWEELKHIWTPDTVGA